MIVLYIGISLSAIGLFGLFWVILSSIKIRTAENSVNNQQDKLNGRLKKVSQLHMISMLCSFFGLILVIIGFIL